MNEQLWGAINRYVVSCGGDPSQHVYGNTERQLAVAEVEQQLKACIRARHHDCTMCQEDMEEADVVWCSNCGEPYCSCCMPETVCEYCREYLRSTR